MKRFWIVSICLFIAWLTIGLATNKPHPTPTKTCGYSSGVDPVTLAATPAKWGCSPGSQHPGTYWQDRAGSGSSPENWSDD